MYYPFSHSPSVPIMLIVGSLALTVVQALLGVGEWWVLALGWVVAGVLAWHVWDIVTRYRLGRVHNHAIFFSWPIIATTLNYAYCYFAPGEVQWKTFIQLAALLLVLELMLGSWQEREAAGLYFVVGLVVGGVSMLLPYTLVWLLLLPLVFFHMRTWSGRNVWSVLTGTAMGIWLCYVGLYVAGGETVADRALARFGGIADWQFALPRLTVWQWAFVGLLVVQVACYGLVGVLLNVDSSLRAYASTLLVSMLSLAVAALSVVDAAHLPLYVGMLSLFLCLVAALLDSNTRSALFEWWTLAMVLLCFALALIPALLPVVAQAPAIE